MRAFYAVDCETQFIVETCNSSVKKNRNKETVKQEEELFMTMGSLGTERKRNAKIKSFVCIADFRIDSYHETEMPVRKKTTHWQKG